MSSSRGSSPVDVPEYSTQFVPGPDDNDTLWNVLEIIKEDKKRYLVKWEGVDPDTGKPWDPSWVPKRDCTDDLIYEWKVTKAKKDKARKKKRKSKGEIGANDIKPSTKSHRVARSKSNTRSSPLSHNPSSSTPGPSRLAPDASSDTGSPVVEILHHKKRRRESHALDGESVELELEEDLPPQKKRQWTTSQRHVISRPPASKDDAESSGQPSRHGDHDQLDVTHPTGASRRHSRSPGGRQQIGLVHKKRHNRSREKGHNYHEEFEPMISSSSRTQSQSAPSQDSFEPGSAKKIAKRSIIISSHSSMNGDLDRGDESESVGGGLVGRGFMGNDGLSDRFNSFGDDGDVEFGVDNGEDQMDDIDHNADIADYRPRSLSPPSPRDLLLGMGKGIDTVIAETQSSVLTSQSEPHAPASKAPLPHEDGKLEGAKQLAKDSEFRTSRVDNKQVLGPVRAISPSEFEYYVSKARSVPGDSQVSSIDSSSLNKGQVITKFDAKRQKQKRVDPQLGDRLVYSRRQGQGPDNQHDSSLHDPIEDYETPPSSEALEPRGARLAETARQQQSLFAPPKRPQRPLSDIISSSISANIDDMERDGQFDMGGNDVFQTESHQHDQGLENGVQMHDSQSAAEFPTASSNEMDNPLTNGGLALHSNDANGMGEDQRELDPNETEELGPEDALDARECPIPPIPAGVHSSAGVNYSLEANPALTQQSAVRQTVIASPVRELNHALGLLNRKSEEIDLLKVALKNHQSRMAELDEELVRLKRNLEVAESRYEEVNAAVNKERAIEVPQEARVDESTSKDLAISSVEYADPMMELHRENEKLKLAKDQLESDTDMLRRLYAQASDAHLTRVMEIKALKRDNDSLREQATTGVKQASLFWTTQVQTLEKELMLSRGTIDLLTDQARRTDNDVRTRAALLPMAQRETEAAKQEIEDWKAKFMELGRENTRLRLEVKEWEDEAIMRRKKEEEMKEQESALQDELVWMCLWMDNKQGIKCGALLKSREELREHLYEAGHI